MYLVTRIQEATQEQNRGKLFTAYLNIFLSSGTASIIINMLLCNEVGVANF